MPEFIVESLLDTFKLVPFLFFAFLLIETVEDNLGEKTEKIIKTSGRLGPLMGSLAGLFPQCGFSILATNLFTTRIITLGTLLAVYLSTSDEMLVVLISEKKDFKIIGFILLLKFVYGCLIGFIIDLIYRKKEDVDFHICEESDCECEKGGVVKAALKHTLNTALYVLIFNLLLTAILKNVELPYVDNCFATALIGLIPNCAGSVFVTELFINGAISFSSFVSGVLCCCGMGLAVLFKTHHKMKENISILLILYLSSVLAGLVLKFIA